MAQVAIREYDAKKMFSEYVGIQYSGYLIESEWDFENFRSTEKHIQKRWVIKPDQLFGKRGKYGLVGVKLDIEGVRDWWQKRNNTEVTIGKQSGKLTTFLVEPFVVHTDEYYVAIKTERDHDVIYFSREWGIDVEENWDTVQEVKIPLVSRHCERRSNPEPHYWLDRIPEQLFHWLTEDPKILTFLTTLYEFFVAYGFAYLEVNPFTFDEVGNVVGLDMVARVDTCESYRQKEHWKNLVFTNPFGAEKSEAEKYIDELDSQTGASLKFRILNPDGRIWLLTSGGGASVIIADTLADLGYAEEIGNYGEASGNPDRENTRAYTDTLIRTMLANNKKWQYIIIAGAIANFTHIDKTFAGVIDALRDHKQELLSQEVTILVRRGGINDKKWLEMMRQACEDMGIPCEIATGNEYMTDILKKIHLWNHK